MAVIFSKQVEGVRYEVRTAGATRRLYTNGAFHTQYNPNSLFTGAVWDLLCLPVLCREQAPASVLVLGVAGGTAIHQLQALCNNPQITGIEFDRVHIELARSHFDLDYPNLKLVHADARDWLARSKQKFDCIIDDIFVHGESDPERPVALDKRWFRQLKSHLNKDGLLIQNHIDHESAKQAASFMKQGSLLGFQTDKYENLVLAWFRAGPGEKRLQRNLESRLAAMPRAVTSRLRSDVFRFSA